MLYLHLKWAIIFTAHNSQFTIKYDCETLKKEVKIFVIYERDEEEKIKNFIRRVIKEISR